MRDDQYQVMWETMKMKTPMVIGLLLYATFTADTQAAYARRPIEAILRDSRVSVIDATVVEITADGHATIKANASLKGSAPNVVKGFFESASYRTPKDALIKADKRYIFVLKGDEIYEDCTFWEILQSFDGELMCYYYRCEPAPELKDENLPGLSKGALHKLSDFTKWIKRVVNAPEPTVK